MTILLLLRADIDHSHFSILASFGAGLIRNDFSPTVHINIGYKYREWYEITATTSSYFFFGTTDAGKHSIYRNTFAGLEFMLNFSPLSKEDPNWNGIGVTYLIEKRGAFFTEPAGMIYYKRKFRNFSIMPGLVLDDNLKDVWPQITIRL